MSQRLTRKRIAVGPEPEAQASAAPDLTQLTVNPAVVDTTHPEGAIDHPRSKYTISAANSGNASKPSQPDASGVELAGPILLGDSRPERFSLAQSRGLSPISGPSFRAASATTNPEPQEGTAHLRLLVVAPAQSDPVTPSYTKPPSPLRDTAR
jgi:hypothetical protein